MNWFRRHFDSCIERVLLRLFPSTYPYTAYMRRINNWTDASDLKKFIAANDNRICSLTHSEKQCILDIWRPWFKGEMLFEGFQMQKLIMGALNPYFVPTYLWLGYILPGLSGYMEDVVLSDKGIYGFYFKDVLRPREIVRNVNGVWYDEDNHLINRSVAIDRLLAYGKSVVVKNSINSCGGASICIFEPTSRDVVIDALKAYNSDFVCQERIIQHKEIARFNPSSLNTFRITTLFLNGRVSKLLCNFRFGTAGAIVDNLAYGGGAIFGIYTCGRVSNYCYHANGKIGHELNDGTKLSSLSMPFADAAVSFAKKLHERIPYCPVVGWDIAINANGNPVLIEINIANTGIFTEQLTCGPLFNLESMDDRFVEVMDYVKNHGPRKHNGGCMTLRFDSYKPNYYRS